jgi:hypothetical protein
VTFADVNSATTTFTMPAKDVTVTANWRPDGGGTNPPAPEKPFISDHVAYIIGYPEGDVRPNKNITRAEIATIFFRLLTDDTRSSFYTQYNPFSDVSVGSWYNNAVSTISNMGIVKGYPDGTFNPGSAITRGELAAIAARFAKVMDMKQGGSTSFSDISGNWAQDDIRYAAAIGWVNGYPDGTFKPDRPITRAEVMTLVNRMLERVPEGADDLLAGEMVIWTDNADVSAWYYIAVQEATNSHVPKYRDNTVPGLLFKYEYWIQLLPNRDWALLEK